MSDDPVQDYGDEEPPDPDAPSSDRDITALIDNELVKARPERYADWERDWMKPVVAQALKAIRSKQSTAEIIEDTARRRVRAREGQATKRANKELRSIARDGQLPLGWGEGDKWKITLSDILRLPLAIGDFRVQLGAAAPADLLQWIQESAAKRRLASEQVELAEQGARLLLDWMVKQEVKRVDAVTPQHDQ